ncbi:MAG TPA: tetratricopeptide repeat protein [Gemmatimonadales bacterium]|nr:tetratricopeptide repeat protein [Gemmatimonadales bacterium]
MADVHAAGRARIAGPEVRRLSERLARDPASLVFLHLGDALRRDGRLDQALRVAENGVARHPDLVDAHALLGRVAADAGRLIQAEACWREVERLAPGHVDAARGLAFIRWCEGRPDEAREYLEEAFARTDDDATRRSITAAINRLSGVPDRRVIAPTPHLASPAMTGGVNGSGNATGNAFVPASGEVAQEMAAVLEHANRLGEAMQIGRWHALIVECDVGLMGVSLSSADNVAEPGVRFQVADNLPVGRAIRLLLQDQEGE